MTAIEDIAGDPKRARVLDGAFKTFLTYGFARTTMDDIAKAALYLASDDSANVTGIEITVDGGMTSSPSGAKIFRAA